MVVLHQPLSIFSSTRGQMADSPRQQSLLNSTKGSMKLPAHPCVWSLELPCFPNLFFDLSASQVLVIMQSTCIARCSRLVPNFADRGDFGERVLLLVGVGDIDIKSFLGIQTLNFKPRPSTALKQKFCHLIITLQDGIL